MPTASKIDVMEYFGVPMMWKEPMNLISDCNFYLIPLIGTGIMIENIPILRFPNLPSAIRFESHSDTLPFPTPPTEYSLDSKEWNAREVEPSTTQGPDFIPEHSNCEKPHRITSTL